MCKGEYNSDYTHPYNCQTNLHILNYIAYNWQFSHLSYHNSSKSKFSLQTLSASEVILKYIACFVS